MTHNSTLRSACTAAVLAFTVVALSACTDDAIVSLPAAGAGTPYWGLTTNISAATVAIGGTQALVAVPRNPQGAPLAGAGTPTFRSIDPTKVAVDSNGVVTGLATTDGVGVVASLTINGLTHADTTVVAVTTTRRSLASLKLTDYFGGPLETTLYIGTYPSFTYEAKDSANVPVTGLSISVKSLDPRIVTAYTSSLTLNTVGKTKIVLSSTSYGVTIVDTIPLFVLYAQSSTVYISAGSFYSNSVTLGTGGTVTWNNNSYTQEEANITFSADSPPVTGGSITSLLYGNTASRTFTTPGIYRYTNTKAGTSGVIIVQEQPTF